MAISSITCVDDLVTVGEVLLSRYGCAQTHAATLNNVNSARPKQGVSRCLR